MMNKFLPFAKPDISQEAIDEVVACIKSGWLTTGPRTKQFEKNLETYLGAPYALCMSSATAGLHLSLLAFDLQPGDEVITTPMTFAATLNTIILAGAKPVLVDVDLGTYNIDVSKIADAITDRTRAIVPVHFAGLPVDLDPLYALAKKHNLRILEDAAHAIGSAYKSKRIGSFGDTQVFSFHPNKNMTTGEGGCVTTRDEAITKQMMLARFHGMDREAWNRFGKSGQQDYQIIFPGLKYNMMDIQAALGLHQLKRLDNFIEKRQHLAKRYYEKLSDWDVWQLPTTPDYEHLHAWHLFAPLINPEKAGMSRSEFMTKMKENNVGTGLHYQAVHLYPYYREHYGFKEGDFPHAETIGERVVSLPLFPSMTEAEQDLVVEVMHKVIRS